jgi:hypothetical protein
MSRRESDTLARALDSVTEDTKRAALKIVGVAQAQGLSEARLASQAGGQESSLNYWKVGKQIPKLGNLVKFASVVGLIVRVHVYTPAELAAGGAMSDDARRLAQIFDSLSEKDQGYLLAVAHTLQSRPSEPAAPIKGQRGRTT